MSLESVVAGLTGTHAEVYEQIQAMTVLEPGTMSGADLQGLMIGAGLMPLVYDTAQNTSVTDVVFRGICLGLLARFGPDGEIDFSRADTQALLDAFLSNTTVGTILAAGPYTNAATFRAAVLAVTSVSVPEFPNVTLRDIVLIRDPTFVAPVVTDAKLMTHWQTHFLLHVHDDLPCTIPLRVEMRLDENGSWLPVKSAGALNEVKEAGIYPFRAIVDRTTFETYNCYIRVVSDFVINMSL